MGARVCLSTTPNTILQHLEAKVLEQAESNMVLERQSKELSQLQKQFKCSIWGDNNNCDHALKEPGQDISTLIAVNNHDEITRVILGVIFGNFFIPEKYPKKWPSKINMKIGGILPINFQC